MIYCQKCSIMIIIIILHKKHKHQVPLNKIRTVTVTTNKWREKSRPVKRKHLCFVGGILLLILISVNAKLPTSWLWKKVCHDDKLLPAKKEGRRMFWTTLNYNNLLSLRMHKMFVSSHIPFVFFYDWEMFPFFFFKDKKTPWSNNGKITKSFYEHSCPC